MNLENKSVVIIGATSGIARALAEEFARAKCNLHLAARSLEETERLANDLTVRHGIKTSFHAFDALNFETHKEFVDTLTKQGVDGFVVVFGELGDQKLAETEFSEAKRIIDINFTGAASVLTYAANYLEAKQAGFIIGICSVAGDRGRQSNYIYGSAKGAFALFLQGLRNRLSKSNVKVMTVKPGFVDTRMTFGREGMILLAKPEPVAKSIIKSLKGPSTVVYVPWFWRYIMLIIRSIPEPIFMRMKL